MNTCLKWCIEAKIAPEFLSDVKQRWIVPIQCRREVQTPIIFLLKFDVFSFFCSLGLIHNDHHTVVLISALESAEWLVSAQARRANLKAEIKTTM